MSGTLKVSGLCRCCFSDGEFRSLDAPYKCDENDSYSALLQETLNITIKPMPGLDNASTYTICDGCASRLQDAAQFRSQVLECETKFAAYMENYLRGDCSFSASKIQIEAETLQDEEIEHVKEEIKNVNAMSPDEGDNYFNEFDCKIDVCEDGTRIDDARSHVLDNHIFSQDSRNFSGLSCDRTFDRYHCAFCTKTFPQLKSLKSHELAHTEKSGFICDYCQKRFGDKRKLKFHIYYHTRKNISEICGYFTKKASTSRVHLRDVHDDKMSGFICDYCKKKFNDKIKLKHHIKYHTGNYTCKTCGYFTKNASGLRVHIKNVHEKIKAFKCDLCPKTYRAKSCLMEHRTVHTGEFPNKCDVCFKSYRFRSSLNVHMHRHLLKSIKQDQARIGTESRPDNLNNECPICGKSFEYKYLLRKHLSTHTRPFQCDVCGQSFSSKSNMAQHQKQHYPGERETKIKSRNSSGVNRTDDVEYSCDFCKQIFYGSENLRSHLLAKHISPDPRIISCPLCGLKFKGRETCLKHLMLHKTAQYHCDFCINTFPTPSSMRAHKRTHIKKFGYTCDYCQRGFQHKKSLINHINEHNMGNLRQYVCETCGFITTQALVFKGHARAVHEKLSPFKCDLCPKSYTMNKNLLDHKRVVHAGVFPYKCDVCSQRFRSKSHINKHKLRHKH